MEEKCSTHDSASAIFVIKYATLHYICVYTAKNMVYNALYIETSRILQ